MNNRLIARLRNQFLSCLRVEHIEHTNERSTSSYEAACLHLKGGSLLPTLSWGSSFVPDIVAYLPDIVAYLPNNTVLFPRIP